VIATSPTPLGVLGASDAAALFIALSPRPAGPATRLAPIDEYAAFVRYCFEDPLDAAIFRSRFEVRAERLKLAGEWSSLGRQVGECPQQIPTKFRRWRKKGIADEGK
jgi:hypothetical protein